MLQSGGKNSKSSPSCSPWQVSPHWNNISFYFFIKGIWWVFEFISTYIGFLKQNELIEIDTCALEIVLDIPNLLAVSWQSGLSIWINRTHQTLDITAGIQICAIFPFWDINTSIILFSSQGFLIFLSTVCKKSVLKGLQETTGLSITKDKPTVTESSNNTKDTNVASTAMWDYWLTFSVEMVVIVNIVKDVWRMTYEYLNPRTESIEKWNIFLKIARKIY